MPESVFDLGTDLKVSASVVSGDFEYEVLSDDTVKITNYVGTSTSVLIPEKLGGKTVSRIGDAAFFNTKIVTLTIPKNYAKFYGFKCFDFLAGDANGDTKVNMKDLVLLQRHLNGWGVEIDLTVCDLTGDKKVNMKDYVALQRQLNGWT